MKYVEYLQTDGSYIVWETGLKIGNENSSFSIELDFMPLRTVLRDTFISDESGNFNILFRVWSERFQTALGNLANNANITENNRYEVVFNYSSNSGNVKCDNVDVIQNQSVTLKSQSVVGGLFVNYSYNGSKGASARYYGLKITIDGVEHSFKPCLDENDNPCFYDVYNNAYLYHQGTGTPTAGPILPTIIVSADKTRVPASGGTINVTVNSDYDWTASSTGNWYTMSSTSGTSADTAITITVPSTTSVTQVEDTILFTNATGDTGSFTIKQLKYSVGVNNLFVGTENVEGMMIGGQEVEAIYLGTEVVYSPGPFVGLKVRPSEISFAKESGLTKTLKVKSSEAWTLALPNDATWLSANTLSGISGETIVTLSTTEENTGDTRTAIITATTESFSATCTVNQNVVHYVSWIFTTNPTDGSDYRDGIEIGNVWSADAEFRIKGTMQGYSTGNGVLTNYDGTAYAQTRWFWVGGNMYYDMNGGRIQTSFTPTSGVDFDYTISNWGVYNNLTSSYVMSGTPKSSIQAGVVWLNMRTCKISSIEVKQENTVVFDGKAAIDDVTGNIGLYDSVSKTLFYNSNLSMTYGE